MDFNAYGELSNAQCSAESRKAIFLCWTCRGRRLSSWTIGGSSSTVVPFATQCLWFDGSAFPIAQPQNQPGRSGHCLYRGTAPIFFTTTDDDMRRLSAAAAPDPHTGLPQDANASMVLRRLKVYTFKAQLPKPRRPIPFCSHCVAQLVLGPGS